MIDVEAAELERLARVLGGGWRIEAGVMPVVVLTIAEARALAAKLGPYPAADVEPGREIEASPCRGCGRTQTLHAVVIDGEESVPIEELQQGWTFTTDDGWRCPSCQETTTRGAA